MHYIHCGKCLFSNPNFLGGVEKVRALANEQRWLPSALECAFDPKSSTSTRMPG